MDTNATARLLHNYNNTQPNLYYVYMHQKPAYWNPPITSTQSLNRFLKYFTNKITNVIWVAEQ